MLPRVSRESPFDNPEDFNHKKQRATVANKVPCSLDKPHNLAVYSNQHPSLSQPYKVLQVAAHS